MSKIPSNPAKYVTELLIVQKRDRPWYDDNQVCISAHGGAVRPSVLRIARGLRPAAKMRLLSRGHLRFQFLGPVEHETHFGGFRLPAVGQRRVYEQ